MTGSLQTKNGKFYMVINLYENGKRKAKWISTGLTEKGNKRRAEQMLQKTLVTYEPPKPSENMLLSDYVRHWMQIISHKVDAVTYQGYEALANAHVLPYFDENRLTLANTTVATLQPFFDEKAISGRKDGKGGLSTSTLIALKNIINQTLKEAIRSGLITVNYCQFVILPKRERYQSMFYNVDQLNDLLDAMAGDPLLPLVRITALYGLRRSELLGLQWDSIDFARGMLTIKHTVSKVTSVVAKDKTKNASSHRSFPLTAEARSIFEEAKREETVNRRLFGMEYQENAYVFKWPNGTPFHPDYVSKHFALVLRKNNLPHIRFHELRHSCASLLLNSGFTLKDVQEWMGHSDIKMTANIYGHLDIGRKQGMADRLSSALK